MTTSYVAGTVSVSAGGRTVTGVGTSWILANVAPGFFGLQGEIGPVIPVERVVSDTELLLYVDWPGATVSGASYWLSYDTRDGQQSVNNAVRLSEYIARLDSDSLSAIAALEPASDTLIMFTGSSTATLIPVGQLGGLFDAQVPNLAARAAYDESPSGFKVLVSDSGDGIAALYSKKNAASGDWSEPAYITGSQGEAGPSGPFTQIQAGTTTTLPAGSQATVSVVPVSEGAVRLDFGLPKGVDGTGTGDVVGPNGGVTAKQIAGFGSNTGKAIVGLTPAEARAASLVPVGGFRNKIINALFSINQRGVSGTVTLAAGAYGHDRIRAGAAGCTYSFSTNNGVTTLNITSGSIQQVIEANSFYGEAGTYYLSWLGSSQGRISGGAYGTTGQVSAVVSGSANVIVEFGVGTLSMPQFERDYVTPFSTRAVSHEQSLCYRYYERTTTYYIGRLASNLVLSGVDRHRTFKRVAPTFSFFDLAGNASRVTVEATNNIAITDGSVSGSSDTTVINIAISTQGAGSSVYLHWIASAEL